MLEIDPDSFAAAHSCGAVVLDVREPEEHADGHVPGARLAPLGRLSSVLPGLPRSGQIYVICASGNRSRAGAEMLRAAGLEAYSVAGGTAAWSAAGRPIVTGTHER